MQKLSRVLKICGALNKTSSATCHVCKSTISQFNNIHDMYCKPIIPKSLKYGISILHAHIRFMEMVLHISYRMTDEKEGNWQLLSNNTEMCAKADERKKYIQRALRDSLPIIINTPIHGSGNTNDENTARKFFSNPDIVFEVTGFNLELLERIDTNTDTFHRLLATSDPLIYLTRNLKKKKSYELTSEIRQLLIIDDGEFIEEYVGEDLNFKGFTD
ncbi:hypothetical protein TKK_0009868 [Trichogramma kaykai]